MTERIGAKAVADGSNSPNAPRNKALPPGDLLLALVLSLATAFFMLGIALPIVKLNRFFFFTDAHSIVSMIRGLFLQGELLLGLIILIFSVVLPAAKIVLLSWLLVGGRDRVRPPVIAILVGALGKWSMLDVLLVALVIFAVKTSGLGTAASLPGLYFFTASVAMTMLVAARVPRAARSTTPSRQPRR